MVEKITSGGQTGADIGGLRAARAAGIPTGGWCAKDWLTENGPDPSLESFGLVCETISDGKPARTYRIRTRLNVRDCDLVVWFGDPQSPGGVATAHDCHLLGKGIYYVLDGRTKPSDVADLIRANPEAKTVMIAGNRESKSPGIGARVERFLGEVFRRLK